MGGDETKGAECFLKDTGVLSLSQLAMTLVEMHAFVRARLLRSRNSFRLLLRCSICLY